MPTLIDIGKKETLCLQVDDKDLLQGLSQLKKNYEKMETQLDEGYACKIGESEYEYDMSLKGFKSLYKDMKTYYDGLIKTIKDEMKTELDGYKSKMTDMGKTCDAKDGEIKALKAQIDTNADNADLKTKAKELSSLVFSASKSLNCDADQLWDLSERDIKAMVISKVYPKLNIDGESDTAIDAMYRTCQFYKEDPKSVLNRQKEALNNVVRVNANVNQDSYSVQEPSLPQRYKQKTEAWKQSLINGGV